MGVGDGGFVCVCVCAVIGGNPSTLLRPDTFDLDGTFLPPRRGLSQPV